MIGLTLEMKNLDKLIAANKSFAKRLPGAVFNGTRRPLRRAVTKIRQRIRKETGIGRSVFGGKGKGIGLERVVKMIRPKIINSSTLIAGISLKGFPMLLEKGGRIKPHLIKNAWGRALVKHPGAPVRGHFIATQEINKIGPQILTEVDKDINKLRAKVFNDEYAT